MIDQKYFPLWNQHLETAIVRWAQAQTDVLAVLVIGSRARLANPADDWSDLDLILFVTDHERYASDTGWLSEFGEVIVSVFERHPSGDVEHLVVYADAAKADFYFTPGTAVLDAIWPSASYAPVIRRGARVLFARPDVVLTLPTAVPPSPSAPPTAADLQTAVHATLLNGWRVAKYLRRGDLWRARQLLDGRLRASILTMTEWHAQAQHGPHYDVWYDGRFLDQWADARVLAALPGIFGGYTIEQAWQNLLDVLDLFHWLAQETAVAHAFTYPHSAAAQITAWIRDLYLTKDND